jgi:small subunit ribosomal protein S7
VFRKALTNVTPQVEVRSRRVGGANFQIPQAVREDRKKSLAMKWLIGYARNRNERSMAMKLANEILAASKEEGGAFKKKEEIHKMAEANKAFSHFRF